jgi:uncharacterized protein YdiU (UPF0061 family)
MGERGVVDDALDMPTFESRFTDQLPADPEAANHIRQVHNACYSRVQPARVTKPQLIAHSQEVAALLELPAGYCASPEFVEVMAGNRLLEGMDPHATCYGGHQFGNWAGQLGDGRAINLGERVTSEGDRWVLQLKGAGPTPYSRSADGLAVLRSSVREFLCSEAMHHLGVPTTRALSLVTTGEDVERDMFYDGHPRLEPGAVVCRVAPSFTRFGNFEIFAARGEHALLKQLADYTIETDFPHLGTPSIPTYIAWYEDICRRTADMIVHWMRVGFVHGVMNTDNMSVLGLTIDYGPYGWLDNFDPDWTPNTTDATGKRYRFGHQPDVALWNLMQFGNALYPLVQQAEPLQAALDTYSTHFRDSWNVMMRGKLGLGKIDQEGDAALISDLLVLLTSAETDMTIFFRKLADVALEPLTASDNSDTRLLGPLQEAYYAPDALSKELLDGTLAWLRRYARRIRNDGTPDADRREQMNRVNPKYVLRNYLAQLAIDSAEKGDPSLVIELLDMSKHPYNEQPAREDRAGKRPDWARSRAGCSMLSCSS